MTDHHTRLHTKPTPQPSQRHRHHKRHRLHHIHTIERRRTRRPLQHIHNPPIHKPLDSSRTLPKPLRKHPRRRQQPQRHPNPLRPLTNKHEPNPPTNRRPIRHNPIDDRPSHQSAQAGKQLVTVASDDNSPMVERRPTGHKREADIGSR
jgi:hypothetical protein